MGNDEGWEGSEEGTWIPAMRLTITMLKDVIPEIEAGKLSTIEEVETALQSRYADAIKDLEEQMAHHNAGPPASSQPSEQPPGE